MKKICVSTYCEWSSYGSVMQTIGLKNTLYKLGFESMVVRDKPASPQKLRMSLHLNKNFRNSIKNIYDYAKRKEIGNRYEGALSFIHDNVDILYYDNYDVLKNNLPKADYYIAGSDQVWNPKSCRPAFFLDFVPCDKKRISYAASMGNTNIPESKKEIFRDFVSKFNHISVREQDNAEVIKDCVGQDATVHIDPTFLMSSEEWRNYEKPYNIEGKYILLYALYWDKKLNKELRKLHKATGLPVVAICGGLSSIWANKKLFNVDPGQFLWLIDHAEAVISSSFHGVALSVIFNKKIAAVVNPKLPSRIDNILDSLEVEKITIQSILKTDASFYENTNRIISIKRNESVDYLRKVLSEDE